MELSPKLVERLIYGFGSHQRLTQDSPVLPEVWAYFASPSAMNESQSGLIAPAPTVAVLPDQNGAIGEPLELLLTPHFDASPATLAGEIRQRLEVLKEARAEDGEESRKPRKIAYTQSYVAARLYFDEVARVLFPLTPWWRTYVWKGMFRDTDGDATEDRHLQDMMGLFDRKDLVRALERWSQTQSPESLAVDAVRDESYWVRYELPLRTADSKESRGHFVEDDLLWMLRIVGTLQWAREQTPATAEAAGATVDEHGRIASLPTKAAEKSAGDGEWAGEEKSPGPRVVDYRPIVDAGCDLLESPLPVVQAAQPSLWQISRNRPAASAVTRSRQSVKADAAIQLFNISCSKLAWAVLDSGIDATHPAFLIPETEEEVERRRAAGKSEPPPWHQRTRVKKTYDFTRLRPLLDQEVVREIINAGDVLAPNLRDDALVEHLRPFLRLIHQEDAANDARAQSSGEPLDRSQGRLRLQLEELMSRLEQGREVDWQLLDPLLEVPYAKKDDPGYRYPVPTSSHGTHVAGILAGDWPEEGFAGICPDLWLYDMRVLDPHGPNDEFTVLAALQFVQYLNMQKEILTIQGANLSLSIRHKVSTYACGRTPVCEECERLVSTGVVVVAAGGNAGWDDDLALAATGAGYRTVSITDPGNAEAVITVGATHRDSPHTYGVSFFSSRGPTGDGRAKPDLVAPGEKITSIIPGRRMRRDDGTSMAAPHVSGAAALLMARHRELIGRPLRVKEILCQTATDLGRVRHFQGAGMVDVLRALQSI